ARAGFDAIHLDGEHGAFNPVAVDDIVSVAHAHGMSVTARVPNINANEINRWLDRGLQGIMGPHIENAEEAQALADACLFPPDGRRSWGGGRGTEHGDIEVIEGRYGGKLGFANFANANMLVGAQIESKEAAARADEILAIPGLAAIAWGPHDMAASLGHPGEPEHPEVLAVHEEVEAKVRAAGKHLWSDYATTMDMKAVLIGQGREFTAAHRDDAFT
ncbi:MAG: hypothetical protein IIC30_05350, partial [Chloroflexi bacterium]|nr:hypothetical protein [Chloroflexota bacterium]